MFNTIPPNISPDDIKTLILANAAEIAIKTNQGAVNKVKFLDNPAYNDYVMLIDMAQGILEHQQAVRDLIKATNRIAKDMVETIDHNHILYIQNKIANEAIFITEHERLHELMFEAHKNNQAADKAIETLLTK